MVPCPQRKLPATALLSTRIIFWSSMDQVALDPRLFLTLRSQDNQKASRPP
ncbi:hypothetical protein FOXYSP1_15458 [Fusarium oxysporum f. sp. phaseoli]